MPTRARDKNKPYENTQRSLLDGRNFELNVRLQFLIERRDSFENLICCRFTVHLRQDEDGRSKFTVGFRLSAFAFSDEASNFGLLSGRRQTGPAIAVPTRRTRNMI